MRFWDSSAIVPLLVGEVASDAMREEADAHPATTVWWATVVECVSAIARRERAERSGSDKAALAIATLSGLSSTWVEIPPTQPLREDAWRLVRVHDLRAADAFQLAAARIAADGGAGSLPFVTLDERLAVAASREGFPVVGPG